MNISYQEIKPSPLLAPYVDCYWMHTFGEGPATDWSPLQRCLPFGAVELIVHLGDNLAQVFVDGNWQELPKIFMAGMYHDVVLIRANPCTRKFGIRMKPEMFNQLFKTPSSVLFSHYTSLDNMVGTASDQLAEALTGAGGLGEVVALTEAYLMQQLAKNKDEHNYVIEATKLIRSTGGSLSVEEISKSVYVSVRQLQRGFRETLGTSPKTYGRMIRFKNAYRQLHQLEQSGGLTGLSYDLGYADQAHFIREFKAFSGTLPTVMRLGQEHVYGKAM